MDSQTLSTQGLTNLYIQNRFKSVSKQTQAFQLLEKSHKEISDVINNGSLLMSDLAKRLYINQLKLNQYRINLSKYQDISQIENKYEKLPELEDSLLYQLVTNTTPPHQNYNYQGLFIEDTSASFSMPNYDNNQIQMEDDFFQEYSVKQEAQPFKKNQLFRNSFAQIENVSELKPVHPKNTLKTKKYNNYIAKAGNGILPIYTKKKSKGYQILPQTKLEMPSKYSLLSQAEIVGKRLTISLDKDMRQEKKKRQEQTEKQQRKQRIRQETGFVAQFVHSYLVNHLKYTDDHTNYIPKKSILSLYLNWCKGINHKILFPSEMNLIQMFLTNQLKIAFSRIDVYSNNYKGLYLVDFPTSFLLLNDAKNKSKENPNAQAHQNKRVDLSIQDEEPLQIS